MIRPRQLLATSLVLLTCATARAVNLYQGSLGTAPEAQGWLAFGTDGSSATRVTAGGKTTLDTTPSQAEKCGYANYNLIFPVNAGFPALDRNAGYIVSLEMKLLSESHASTDRSGVSLIALSSDLLGIEIAFWNNEVWVQSGSDFHHAEGAPFTTTNATTYDLLVHGTTYQLFANGSELLNGNLRNYSAFGLPYTLPNFVFLGDDTTSASGSFEFSRLSAVPEPVTVSLGALALLVLRRR
ncbi:MAG: choice-of-anchor Y domain-containing protein [Tepidisphaeraceae bacterium]